MSADGTFRIGFELDSTSARRVEKESRDLGPRVAQHFNLAAAEAKGASVSMGSSLLSAVTGPVGMSVAAAGLLIHGFKATAESMDRLEDSASALNASVEGIQRLKYMADGTTTPFETLTSSLTAVKRAVMDVDNEAKRGALERIGLTDDYLSLDADKQFIALSEAFQKAQATGVGFTEIFKLVKGVAPDLIPALRSTKEELEAMSDKAVVSAETIRFFTENLGKMKMFGMQATNSVFNAGAAVADYFRAFDGGVDSWLAGEGFMVGFYKKESELQEAASESQKKAAAERKAIADAEMAHRNELLQWRKKERDESLQKSVDAANDETPQQKLVTVQRNIAEITKEIADDEGRIAKDSDYKLKRQIELNGLIKSEIDLKKEAQKSAEGVANSEADIRIQELKNSRRFVAADKLKKAEDEKREFQRLRDAHPEMGEEWAHNMARRSAQAKDDAAHPGRIHGVKYTPSWRDQNPLDWLYGHNQNRGGASLRSEFHFHGMDQMTRGIGEIVDLLKEK